MEHAMPISLLYSTVVRIRIPKLRMPLENNSQYHDVAYLHRRRSKLFAQALYARKGEVDDDGASPSDGTPKKERLVLEQRFVDVIRKSRNHDKSQQLQDLCAEVDKLIVKFRAVPTTKQALNFVIHEPHFGVFLLCTHVFRPDETVARGKVRLPITFESSKLLNCFSVSSTEGAGHRCSRARDSNW